MTMRNRVPLPRATFTRIAIMATILLAFLLLADVSRVVSAPQAQRQTKEFALGDVLVAVKGGKVEWHNPDGSLFRMLDTTVVGYTAGLAFDPTTRNLYVTNFLSNTVSYFDPIGNFLGRFGAGYEAGPTSILFDASGNVFVGQAGALRLIKLDANGHLRNRFEIAFDNQGFTWIDLASDQCTMYYTTNGRSIKRFDVCQGVQKPDFTVNPLPGTAYALRLIPDGGLLVADSAQILRLDMNGTIVQSYGRGENTDWFGMSLDPDRRYFWSTNLNSNTVSKFELATGRQPLTFTISTNSTVGGLAVFGENPAATSITPTAIPTSTSTRTPTLTSTPTPTLTPKPPPAPTLTFTPAPTSTTAPPQTPPIPPPSLLPTRPPVIPTPTPPPDILPLVGFTVGGLASLVVIAAMALVGFRHLTRPNVDRSDRVERAESQVRVQSRDDPGKLIVEPIPHSPAPLVRLSLGQGEVTYVIETAIQKKPGEE